MSDHFIDGPEAQFRHDLTQFPCHEPDEIDDVVGSSGEPLAQFRILCGHAYRTGVQMAFPHHDAAFHDEGRGGHAPFFCTEQGGDGDVTTGLHLPVSLHGHSASQPVADKGLMGFRQSEFPGKSGMPDRADRRGARTTVVSGDQDDIGFCLGHPGGDRPHPGLGHQFYADAGLAVGILQIEDQLRQIFDGIDIMVRGRGYESHARRGMTYASDPVIHLMAGQLSAFSGFGTLCHFDLKFICLR